MMKNRTDSYDQSDVGYQVARLVGTAIRSADADDGRSLSGLVHNRDYTAPAGIWPRIAVEDIRIDGVADRRNSGIAVVGPRYGVGTVSVADAVQRDVVVHAARDQCVVGSLYNLAERACTRSK